MFAQTAELAKPQILMRLELSGHIEIVQNEQIESLLRMNIANNRQQKGIPGYRISIFSQSGQTARGEAERTRATFMRSFPQIEAYQEYNSPNFQIFVGNFRTKNEALRELKKIERHFPRAFIVNATIQIPK